MNPLAPVAGNPSQGTMSFSAELAARPVLPREMIPIEIGFRHGALNSIFRDLGLEATDLAAFNTPGATNLEAFGHILLDVLVPAVAAMKREERILSEQLSLALSAEDKARAEVIDANRRKATLQQQVQQQQGALLYSSQPQSCYVTSNNVEDDEEPDKIATSAVTAAVDLVEEPPSLLTGAASTFSTCSITPAPALMSVSGLNPVDTKSSSSSGGSRVGPDSSGEPAQILNITYVFVVAARWRPAQAAAEKEQLMMATAPTPLDTG